MIGSESATDTDCVCPGIKVTESGVKAIRGATWAELVLRPKTKNSRAPTKSLISVASLNILPSWTSAVSSAHTLPYDTIKIDRGYWVRDALATQPESILVESEQQSAAWSNGTFNEIGECINRQSAQSVYRNLPYTPAPAILNAAYPVRLEQLP